MIKTRVATVLGKLVTSMALAITYVTVMDWPCLIIGGEPDLPEELRKIKEDKQKAKR